MEIVRSRTAGQAGGLMEATQLDFIFGWAALLSAVATIGTLVTGILFFAVNERFGKINDIVSVFQVVLMLPVAVAMYLLTRPSNGGLALLALAVGSMGMVIVAVLQALLVVEMVSFEQTIRAVLSAGAVIGLWLVLANVVALGGGYHSSRLRRWYFSNSQSNSLSLAWRSSVTRR